MWTFYYDFIRPHSSLGRTPAEEAGLVRYHEDDDWFGRWERWVERASLSFYLAYISTVFSNSAINKDMLEVLFIGFDSIPTPRKDEKFEPVFLVKERLRDYVITRPLNGMPAIDFYHVVFISASALKSWEITEIILNDRLDQFKRLLNADFCGSVVVNLLPKIDYTKLLGIKPDRINDSGETMEVNEESVFSHAIKQYKKNFHWDCHLVERLGEENEPKKG